MNLDFATIAPYLKDPLVLIGFVLFLGFLFTRKLLTTGIIPPVGAKPGAGIIRLILHYGFVIGLIVILLGFGLKYRDLSEEDQQRAIGLLVTELDHNIYVASELEQNTITLTNSANIVAGALRIGRLKINHLLFPNANKDPLEAHDPDRYNKLYEELTQSGLTQDPEEVRRFQEQCGAINRSIDRIMSTVKSLADSDGNRYVIQRAAYDANLPILRKISIVPVDDLGSLYAKTEEQRQEYFRVADSVIQYLSAVRAYCGESLPLRAELGGVLAAEKLSFQLLDDHQENLQKLSARILKDAESLKQVRAEIDL